MEKNMEYQVLIYLSFGIMEVSKNFVKFVEQRYWFIWNQIWLGYQLHFSCSKPVFNLVK